MSEMVAAEPTRAGGSADDIHMTSSFWFSEDVTPDLVMKMRLNKISFDAKSAFQRVQVIETESFGKTLVLDGKTQSAQRDEFVYHECLVHPALLAHGNPKSVYIGGGGELATARECLRHKSVEKVVMVDLDKIVVDICREQLPEWNADSTSDPRLELHYTDAHAFLKDYDGTFDVIVMDIADPIEAGPGIVLYTAEFYELAKRKLNPGGVIVTQSGPGGLFTHVECFTAINHTLGSVFAHVAPYTVGIPSFGSDWAFNLAFDSLVTAPDGALPPAASGAALGEQDAAAVDAAIASRLSSELRFLDGVALRGVFGLCKPIRLSLAAEERVITVENPVFMY